jgi:peptidoglycan L-alanyl-D-glutamate endopeptidase CwlK
MASREIKHLSPALQILYNRFNDRCRRDEWMVRNGITVLLICTYRSSEEQDRLYAQGRTAPGRRVTNLRGGKSRHNATLPGTDTPAAEAFDVVPLRGGKPVWGTGGAGTNEDSSDDATNDLEVWQRVGAHGEAVGLVWGGSWTSFKDYPHFEMPRA